MKVLTSLARSIFKSFLIRTNDCYLFFYWLTISALICMCKRFFFIKKEKIRNWNSINQFCKKIQLPIMTKNETVMDNLCSLIQIKFATACIVLTIKCIFSLKCRAYWSHYMVWDNMQNIKDTYCGKWPSFQNPRFFSSILNGVPWSLSKPNKLASVNT